jgi:hypothetical protein
LTIELHNRASLAVVLSGAIGDSLITMVLVNNLVRNGYAPTVFGWVAEQLAEWFPGVQIGRASPGDRDAAAASFDTVIELHTTPFGCSLSCSGATIALCELPGFSDAAHMVDRMVDVCTRVFGLRDVTRANGMAVPARIARGSVPSRVAIHPSGSHPEKIWSQPKFVALARALAGQRMASGFLVAPDEYREWESVAKDGFEVNAFARLDDVAEWIAEAGWFIGNDSGLGHLASAIGVPTLSIFMRRGLARTWRPGWGIGAIALPLNIVLTGRLKERCWKRLLPVDRVLRQFAALRGAVEGGQPLPTRAAERRTRVVATT